MHPEVEMISFLDFLQVEHSEYGQVLRFLELLPDQSPSMFYTLMDILTESGHGWIAQEMRVELVAEKGHLEIEEYVYQEAGFIVQRQFAGSRRIPQPDLKEIQLILAMRYQVAKDSWYEQMVKLHEDLKDSVDWKWKQNSKMKDLSQNIAAFLKLQKNNINEYAHDSATDLDLTRDDLDPEGKRRDYSILLERSVSTMLEVLSRLILDKERMIEEKDRCLKVLKISKPCPQLDVALQDALLKAAEELVQSRSQATVSTSKAQSAEGKLKKLKVETDQMLAEQQQKLMYWESLALQREDRIMRLDRQLADAEQKRVDADEQVQRWKQKCFLLEKTRRLGYYNPGRCT